MFHLLDDFLVSLNFTVPYPQDDASSATAELLRHQLRREPIARSSALFVWPWTVAAGRLFLVLFTTDVACVFEEAGLGIKSRENMGNDEVARTTMIMIGHRSHFSGVSYQMQWNYLKNMHCFRTKCFFVTRPMSTFFICVCSPQSSSAFIICIHHIFTHLSSISAAFLKRAVAEWQSG